ncbi:MAG: DUF2971 domain-containing protein [Bryobacterales bacterium]
MSNEQLGTTRPLPPRLYKYQSLSPEVLLGLLDRSLWFSAPLDFNDPFDCRYRVVAEGPSRSQMTLERAKLKADELLEFPKTRSVACFSETPDNLLLWSHYAASHTGVCLEFDTKSAPFKDAQPVSYTDSFPTVDYPSLEAQTDDQLCDSLVLQKAESWSYELEWRIVRREAAHSEEYLPRALTGVYFGLAQPYRKRLSIAQLAMTRSSPELYEMKHDGSGFGIVREHVDLDGIKQMAEELEPRNTC